MSDDTTQYLVLDRCNPSCNMARYYVLLIETSLFGDASLIREWGRIGQPGRTRIELYETQSRAMEALDARLQRKRQRGYELRDGQEECHDRCEEGTRSHPLKLKLWRLMDQAEGGRLQSSGWILRTN